MKRKIIVLAAALFVVIAAITAFAAAFPLITTLNDLIAVCVYYGVSILLFVQIGLFA